MAITTNQITAADMPQNIFGSEIGFEATKSDTNYFEDPRSSGSPAVSKRISLDTEADIAVEFPDGTTKTIPSGILAAGVMHDLRIVKLLSTGTDATVKVWVWL